MLNSNVWFLCLLPWFAMAQTTDTVRVKSPTFQVFKVSPLHLLNFYPSFLIGYEYGFSPNQSVQIDAGPVLDFESYNQEFQRKRGFKLKTEYRYYLDIENLSGNGHYIALEGYWNFVNFNRDVTQTECFDLACQNLFTRDYSFLVKYRETGIALKFGIVRVTDKIIYDWFFGLRLRFVDYKKPNLPPSVENFEDGFFLEIPNETPRTTFGITAGLKLGYKPRPR